MLIATLILFTLAMIIYVNNPKGSSNRWGAGFVFMCALGTLGSVIEFTLPASTYDRCPLAMIFFKVFMTVCYASGIFYAPYFLLKFALLFSEIRGFHERIRFFDIFMNLPVLMSLAVSHYPIKLYSVNYCIVMLYAVPYMTAGGTFILWAALHEHRYHERHSKIISASLTMFVAVACSVVNYINPALGWKSQNWMNLYSAVFVFLSFMIAAYYWGNFGVRIRFENINFSSIEAVHTGASLMNHAIKNELAFISQSVNAIECKYEDPETVKKNLERIKKSAATLLSFIDQVQEQIKPNQHGNETVDLAELIDESLAKNSFLFEEKSIHIIKEVENNWFVCGDPRQLLEVFNNLIGNAVEAMDKGGTLKVRVYSSRFWILVDFEDNGCGIVKENLSHVIEPFFSTKHLSHNYGLGLTFCYNVAKDHGGVLEIESEPHKGTRVSLKIPKITLIKPTMSKEYPPKNNDNNMTGRANAKFR
ncbi:MAG TPA: HAMP domain-containing sensor histidine kinase [Bacillota bacterium]|nr:HAMP domain-containing sensor histidine kinase [Bacillota bacterium]